MEKNIVDTVAKLFKCNRDSSVDMDDSLHKLPVIRVVCLGRTGAGKTTLINCLLNYACGKSYEDERIIAISQQITLKNPYTGVEITSKYDYNLPEFKDKQTDNLKALSHESQTTQASSYSVQLEDYILSIIDTPGIGDTKGPIQDKENIDLIVNQIRKTDELHAILFVCKSTESRLDSCMKYMIQEVQYMLPKAYKDNILICLTAATNPTKIDAIVPLKEMGFDTKKVYKFENDCFIHPNGLRAILAQNDIPDDDDDYKNTDLEDQLVLSEIYWKKNCTEASRLFQKVRSCGPMDSQKIQKLHVSKHALTVVSYYISDTIIEQEKRIDLLKQSQQNIDTAIKLMENNKNWKINGFITE